ncbi:ba3-type terminal oxidase subunit CbaE [Natronomonas moolapensis 8.8.11]|uniref:Ba3-type terminal oxidase subunit CbaE n=1 Tax=Natronomonas moolapensis (strain DSM 18674 / CECT 7526 / JCM 14361 / 8.8.11) TaxID=268739 RepID=M1XR19_NATM8|nr:hypothetical protein [Natronomonas moolapensis]CCQ36644.1 ba3-type terminal oxidase subunit CbaE [Natronomonas moolapensis 8.8.11]
MSNDSISPRVSVVVGLLALAPVLWYGVGGSNTAVAVSFVNVLITIGALLIATGPAEIATGHGGSSA